MEWNQVLAFVWLCFLVWGIVRNKLIIPVKIVVEKFPENGLKRNVEHHWMVFYDQLTYTEETFTSKWAVEKNIYFILPMKLQVVERLTDFQAQANDEEHLFQMYLFL